MKVEFKDKMNSQSISVLNIQFVGQTLSECYKARQRCQIVELSCYLRDQTEINILSA